MQFRVLPQIDDPLVLVRPLVQEDLPRWAAIVQMPDVYEHTSWNLKSSTELTKFVWDPANHMAASPLRLAICSRDSGELVGTIGFHTVSPENCTAELAYELAPTVWGRGIATRLCAALTRWGHDSGGLIRVQATTLESNERSRRVLERCGYNREGLLRNYRLVRNKPGDFYMYASTRVGIE